MEDDESSGSSIVMKESHPLDLSERDGGAQQDDDGPPGSSPAAVDLSVGRPLTSSDEDEEASNLKMRTWMMLWQQQLQQSGQQNAETTMRQLLGLYGIPRETAAQFLAAQAPAISRSSGEFMKYKSIERNRDTNGSRRDEFRHASEKIKILRQKLKRHCGK